MLSDEVIEKVTQRLIERIEQGNTYVLEQIGSSIKKIGTLSPSKARQLAQILKYGGDYDKIIRKLKQITNLNIKDIKQIFNEVAKTDYQFAEQFYKYRNKKYIPFEENTALQNQIDLLTDQVTKQYIQLTSTKAIGFAIKDPIHNKIIFKPLKKAYNDIIDSAVLNVSQGKTTFDQELRRLLKDFDTTGLKTLEYESGRTIRLDSAVRTQLQDGLRTLHNNNQQLFGEQFESDGVEISVHSNPAPDHAEVQGKQFSTVRPSENELSEFEKFQNDIDCYSYDGTFFPAEFNEHDRRAISQYNCYHYVFAVVLGVSRPVYNSKQLQQIIDNNNKGFEFDGKHYTNYQGTQLQRQIERKIREQKDLQILASSSGEQYLAGEAQHKILLLNRKYKELAEVSKLPTWKERMAVSRYRRSAEATRAYRKQKATV